MSPRILALAVALLCIPPASQALEVEGVHFEPVTRVANTPLQLNGAGLRGRSMLKAYVVALYLGAPADSLDSAMAAAGAKRIEVVPLLELSASLFNDPLVKGMKKNMPPAEFEAMQPRIRTFSDNILAIGDLKKGSRIALEWLPGRGTRITIDGHESGETVEGEDFFRSLLSIWLGARPTQEDLKEHLLAGKATR